MIERVGVVEFYCSYTSSLGVHLLLGLLLRLDWNVGFGRAKVEPQFLL